MIVKRGFRPRRPFTSSGSEGARRPLLRRHHEWLTGRCTRYAARVPTDDRWAIVGLHPGAAAQPARLARGRAADDQRQRLKEVAMSADDAPRSPTRRQQHRSLLAGVAGAGPLRRRAPGSPAAVFPLVPGGLPLLDRHHARLPRAVDAALPGRRRLGIPDPAAARVGRPHVSAARPARRPRIARYPGRSTSGRTPTRSRAIRFFNTSTSYLNVPFFIGRTIVILRDLALARAGVEQAGQTSRTARATPPAAGAFTWSAARARRLRTDDDLRVDRLGDVARARLVFDHLQRDVHARADALSAGLRDDDR